MEICLRSQKSAETLDTANCSRKVTFAPQSHNQEIFLSTAIINVQAKDGKLLQARVLLDPGSQSTFISKNLKQKLDLDVFKINTNVNSINQSTMLMQLACKTVIHSMQDEYLSEVHCLIIPNITSVLPSSNVDVSKLNIPSTIALADPTFNIAAEVDMILGGDCFWKLLCAEQMNLNGPTLKKTKLGWVVGGPLYPSNVEHRRNTTHCHFLESQLSKEVEKFWELKNIPTTRRFSLEEQHCEEHFLATTMRYKSGKFITALPLKDDSNLLGDSYACAKSRLLSQERKFIKNESFEHQHKNFIQEYETLGHMVESTVKPEDTSYILPHNGVYNVNSITTKLRIVFDGSAETTSGVSLNDLQMLGPTLQSDLFSILVRFRLHPYVVFADIEKMYRMIWIREEDRKLKQILWRYNENEPIKTFTLNTVTYGTKPASNLAVRCPVELANKINNDLPHVSMVIKEDFYIDDLLYGFDGAKEGIEILNALKTVLQSAGFHLRKWKSNDIGILQSIAHADCKMNDVDLNFNEINKVLGLIWNCQPDNLSYKLSCTSRTIATKRTILQFLARIFDLLGLLGPCTVMMKMILQKLWSKKLGWDERIPTDLYNQWTVLQTEYTNLNDIEIPRFVNTVNSVRNEIQAFCDACISHIGLVYILDQLIQTIKLKCNFYAQKAE